MNVTDSSEFSSVCDCLVHLKTSTNCCKPSFFYPDSSFINFIHPVLFHINLWTSSFSVQRSVCNQRSYNIWNLLRWQLHVGNYHHAKYLAIRIFLPCNYYVDISQGVCSKSTNKLFNVFLFLWTHWLTATFILTTLSTLSAGWSWATIDNILSTTLGWFPCIPSFYFRDSLPHTAWPLLFVLYVRLPTTDIELSPSTHQFPSHDYPPFRTCVYIQTPFLFLLCSL